MADSHGPRAFSIVVHGKAPTKPRAARWLVFAFALLLVLLTAQAQASDKVWRVAVLAGGLPRSAAPVRALEQRLAELGYVEGRNLVIDFRTAEGHNNRLPALAAELVARRPHVIVVISTTGAMAAKNATSSIPIVLGAVGDPVGSGIVPSLARSGTNITGMSMLNVELGGKGLQLLKEALPTASRIVVVWNSENRLHRDSRAATESAAATLAVRVQFVDVRGPGDLPKAFDAIIRSRAEGILVLSDAVSLTHRAPILEFAANHRLPAMYAFREMVDEGGFMSYGPSLIESLQAAAGYVDKILAGATPGNLPIAQATKFDLVINVKTARMLGLTIPQALLLRADDVIQ